MKRIRCCNRFTYWKLPVGPWACTQCDRVFDGPMPVSRNHRFWLWVEENILSIPPWTEKDKAFVRENFGHLADVMSDVVAWGNRNNDRQ